MTDRRPSGLRRIMEAGGVRRVELAAASGCGERTIRRVERGDLEGVKLLTLVRLAHALGVAPVELVPSLALDPPRPGLLQRRPQVLRPVVR